MNSPFEFEKIAEFLKHPLILIGFVLMMVFSIHKQILKSGILPKLNQEQGGVVVTLLLRYGFWLGVLIMLLGFSLQFYKIYAAKPPANNAVNSPQINFSGNQTITGGQFVTGNVITDIKIYATDPPEIKQKKIEKAKQLIASEVIFNIKNLDARLGFAKHSLSLDDADDFKERFDETRKKVAPAIESVAKENYGKLMSQQQAASLRATFNSYPLRTDLEAPLVQVLVDGNISLDRVNTFYKDLREAQYQSEALLETIGDIALASSKNNDTIAYQKRKFIFAINLLQNRSKSAYLSGWVVLKNLEAPISQLNDTITALQYLKPNRILSDSEILQLEKESLAEAEQLLSERKYLVAEAKRITESALTAMADLEEKLKIQPTDTWNQVTGKAKTLRQLGRITDAVAALSRYGEMFSDKDPGAKQYAKTAQLFTTQIADLKLDGGIYIYEISKNSVAEKAGFKVGDIIIDYNGKVTNEMDDLITALKNSPKDELVRITFLRIDDNGGFIRETKTVTGGMLGIAFMPI